MSSRVRSLGLAVWLCLGAGPVLAQAVPAAKFLPPPGKVLVMVGQDKQTLQQYSAAIPFSPGGVMHYTSIQKMDGIDHAADYGAGDQHARWLASEYPHSVLQIGLYMVGALDMVVAGVYDDNLKKLADFFNSHDRPFYLRIGYEFDAPDNAYLPEKYIEAYRYIVHQLRDQGVQNVAFVWHAHGVVYPRSPRDWYPGDEFVDWVGVSYFSPFNDEGMARIAELARSLGKPLMIAESTPVSLSTADGEAAWKRWYPFLYRHIDEYEVRAVCYINSHWDAMPMWKAWHWGDARVETNPFIQGRWTSMMSEEKFLHASPELFTLLGYKSPHNETKLLDNPPNKGKIYED